MLVTVGIPFLDAEATLSDAVRSVFAQTLSDWELILVDDGSTDRSLDTACAIDDERVRVVSDGQTLGLQVRLNQIADMARGEYTARMDADDIMHPERLARQVALMESDPRLDLTGTATYVIDGQNNPVLVRHTEPVDITPGAVVRNGFICHPTAFARADWFRKNRYDTSYLGAEDHELFCRMAWRSNMARIPEPLFYYRENHKNPSAYLHSYLTHGKHLRRCYFNYGPVSIGWPSTCGLILRSWVKTGIFAAATMAGLQHAAISRRHGSAMSEADRWAALDGLNTVMRTKVPGLESREGCVG